MMDLHRSTILGTGSFLPQKILTNYDLENLVDTNHDWIVERTGIHQRRICSTTGGEFPTDMAKEATLKALQVANCELEEIEMIIFASVTPDYKIPNSACILQQKLGLENRCACLDISAACSGFLYGLNMANALIQTGVHKKILIVGSEMLSREIDWTDRGTCILFGDGCGAAIVGRNVDPHNPSTIIATHWESDGSGQEFFSQKIGGAVSPITAENLKKNDHFMQMKGGEMFKVATRTLARNAQEVLKKAKLSFEQIDWFIPHQANYRIIETTCKLLNVPMDKVIINIEKYGNTSAATIPLALDEAILDGRVKRGQTLLLDAFGAGLTSAAIVLTY